MPRRGPNDESHLEMDLFEHLAFEGFVCPDGIEIAVVLDRWVVEYERELMERIIEWKLDDEAPLRRPAGNDEKICITGVEEVDEHVREVEKDLW